MEQHSEAPSSSTFETETTATLAHLDLQQAQANGSLHQLHVKLDSVAKALGITVSGQQTKTGLISAHRGPDQHDKEEVHQQVNSLISQVEATLQQPTNPPAVAIKGSRAQSSSIGTAVQRQLDAVSEQLASQVSCSNPTAAERKERAVHGMDDGRPWIFQVCIIPALNSSPCSKPLFTVSAAMLLDCNKCLQTVILSSVLQNTSHIGPLVPMVMQCNLQM